MGLFKHKDKSRPDAAAPTNNATSTPAPNQTQTPTANNSFNDSTYYSNSDVSAADTQRLSNSQQQRAQGQQPGTTVTTTTTTTTTTTAVAPDGSTYTTSQPYNPSNDPPPQTETTFNPETHHQKTQDLAPTPTPQGQTSGRQTPQAANSTRYDSQQAYQNGAAAAPIIQASNTPASRPVINRGQTPPRKPTPQQVAASQGPFGAPPPPNVTAPTPQAEMLADSVYPPPTQERRKSVTSGGRTIPQREGLTPAYNHNSPDNLVQPPSSHQSNSPPSPNSSSAPNSYDEEVSPMNPGAGLSDDPNYSRPGVTSLPAQPAEVPPSAPAASNSNYGVGRKDNMMNTLKGLHGAGEALRGSLNSTIAKGMHDTAEEERQNAIREQGLSEFRGSGLREQAGGLREGFRQKAEERNRLRRRSGSVQRSQVGHTLDRVEEREVGL